MMKFLSGALASIALFGAAFVSYAYTLDVYPNEDTQEKYAVVHDSPGGEVWGFLNKYAELREKSTNVKVDGICGSACTYLFGFWHHNDICVTPRARFGIHGVYMTYNGMHSIYLPQETKLIMDTVYPLWLVQKIRERGWVDFDQDVPNAEELPFGMLWFTGADLGLQTCTH